MSTIANRAIAGDTLYANGYLINPSADSKASALEKINGGIVTHILVSGEKIALMETGPHCDLNEIKHKKPEIGVVDLSGKFVIPGLHDLHVHNFGMNADPINTPLEDAEGRPPLNHPDYPGAKAMAHRMLYSGVTTHLDLMSFNELTKALQDRQRSRLEPHPMSQIFLTGGLFMPEDGHHGDVSFLVGKKYKSNIVIPRSIHALKDPVARRRKTKELLRAHITKFKPRALKITNDHGHTRGKPAAAFSKEFMADFVSEAKAIDPSILVICHINIWDDIVGCLDAKADAVTHLPITDPSRADGHEPKDIFNRMKKSGMSVITTMTVYMEPGLIRDSLFDVSDERVSCEPGTDGCQCNSGVCIKKVRNGRSSGRKHFFTDPLLNQVAPQRLLNAYFDFDGFRNSKFAAWSVEENDKKHRQKTYLKLMAAGIPVISGTDSMWEGIFFGFSLHRELELMMHANQVAGPDAPLVDEMNVLSTATTNASRFLRHKRGMLKQDFFADFLVLNSNPLLNIKNTRDIADVIQNGKRVDREALKPLMAVSP